MTRNKLLIDIDHAGTIDRAHENLLSPIQGLRPLCLTRGSFGVLDTCELVTLRENFTVYVARLAFVGQRRSSAQSS
jgi:hypothetical protein